MAFRTYLCGTMAGRFAGEVTAERNVAANDLSKIGVWAVDPARSESQLWGKHLRAKISTKFRLKVISAMVKQDLHLIRRSDALLCLSGDNCSDGSWREIAYAQMIGIPVILIAPKRCKGELSGWTNVLIPAGHIVPTLKAAINLIKRKYLKEYEAQRKYFEAAIKQNKPKGKKK